MTIIVPFTKSGAIWVLLPLRRHLMDWLLDRRTVTSLCKTESISTGVSFVFGLHIPYLAGLWMNRVHYIKYNTVFSSLQYQSMKSNNPLYIYPNGYITQCSNVLYEIGLKNYIMHLLRLLSWEYVPLFLLLCLGRCLKHN